jgi:hypothetical protein
MRERLLNPKRLKTDLKSLDVVSIDSVDYRTFTVKSTSVNDGICQCYHNCNCSDLKGNITHHSVTWYRNIKFDNTDKCFYSEPYTQLEYCL